MNLVLVGAGHVHLPAIRQTDRFLAGGHRLTVVSPRSHHFYSGMGPGMLGGQYRPEELRFPVREMVETRGGVFREDRVTAVDADRRSLLLASGAELPFDIVSFGVGSVVADDIVADGGPPVFPVRPIDNLLAARQTVLSLLPARRPRLVVVGGGPAGLETAGNLLRLVRQAGGQALVTLLAGPEFLGGMPDKLRSIARSVLRSQGVEIVEGTRAVQVGAGEAVLGNGRRCPYDIALLATGTRPPDLFSSSALPVGRDGGLEVDAQLRCVGFPGIFGGGDCVHFAPRPLDRVGVYATKEGPLLYRNLLAACDGKALEEFRPQNTYLLLFNLGDGTAVLVRGNLVWHGRAALFLKAWIDRRFVRRSGGK